MTIVKTSQQPVKYIFMTPVSKDCPRIKHPILRCPRTIPDIGKTPTPIALEAMRSTKHAGILVAGAIILSAIAIGKGVILRYKTKPSENQNAAALVKKNPSDAGASPFRSCKELLGSIDVTKKELAACEKGFEEGIKGSMKNVLR